MFETGLLIEMALAMLAIGAFAGVLAGVLAGLLGVGGGIILVPAYFYMFSALGFAGPQVMQVCLATSLATIIVTSIRSVSSHHKKGAVRWDILKSWAVGIAIGAVVGVLTVSGLRSSVLQGIFGLLAIIVGLYMSMGKDYWRLGGEMPTGLKRVILSPLLGFMSVLMGIGGGSFGVPIMSLFNLPIHRAIATAAGFGVLIAVPSVTGFLLLDIAPQSRPPATIGAVNLPAFILTISMTTLTAPYGVKLAHKLDPKPLKRIFGVFLVLVALNMLRKSVGY